MSRQSTSPSLFYSEQLWSTDDEQIKAYLAKCTKYHEVPFDAKISDRGVKIDLGSQFVHDIVKGATDESDKELVFKEFLQASEQASAPEPNFIYVTWPGYEKDEWFCLPETFARAKICMDQVTKKDLKRHIAGVMLQLYTKNAGKECKVSNMKLGSKGINIRQIRLLNIWIDKEEKWRTTFDVAHT